MALLIQAVCCAQPMDGWRHVARELPAGHLWWCNTVDFSLGVIAWADVAGAPFFVWKVRRKSDGNEVEGQASTLIGGANAAVITYERWRDLDRERAKPKREPKWLPASGPYVSPF